MRDSRPMWRARGLGFLIVATTIAVDPYGLVPSGPLRWTVLLVAAAATAAVPAQRRLDRPTFGLWAALVLVLGLAAVAGKDPLHAWIGTPDRRLGFLGWLAFPVVFAAAQAAGDERGRRTVARAAALAGVVVGVWTACELSGRSLTGADFAGGRAGGPWDQPAYLGAAACILLPAATAAAWSERSLAWRSIAAAGAAGALTGALASQTRGAWAGIVVAGALVVVRRPRVPKRWLTAAGAALVVLALATPLAGRAASSFDLGGGTTQGRLDEWRVAVRVIAARPVLGAGPEGYRVVFPQQVDDAYVRRHGLDVVPDRTHNGILEVAAEGGLLAAALWIALLALVVRRAWRAMGEADVLVVGTAAAVVAYVVQQQVLFPLSELDPWFWAMAGLLVGSTSRSHQAQQGQIVRMAKQLAMAGVALVVLVFGFREVAADRDLEAASNNARPAAALAQADAATRLRPDSIRTWFAAARIAGRDEALTAVDRALDRIERGLDRSPRDPALRREHADLLVERASRSGLPEDAALASHVIAHYLEASPNHPRLLADQAAALDLAGDRERARLAIRRAAALAPHDPAIAAAVAALEKP